MKNLFFRQIYAFCKSHWCFLLCAALGLCAGLFGFVMGIIIGIILEKIKIRYLEEKRLIKALEDGRYEKIWGEPFSGALYVSALAFLCLKDIECAVFQLKTIFASYGNYNTWNLYCRCASMSPALNEDLLVECLSSVIRGKNASATEKNDFSDDYKSSSQVPVQDIFRLLSSVEFMWDEKTRGQKPSAYLAELLNYKYISDELADAYRVLGLKPGDSMEKVKSVHRKLAAKFHPDVSDAFAAPDKKNSLSSFLRIQAAYETIVRQLS